MKVVLKAVVAAVMTYGCAAAPQTSDLAAAEGAQDACGGKPLLVVTSSAAHLTLADGSKYPTGVFLREITDPVIELKKAGCKIETASPGGLPPTIDNNSLELLWAYHPYLQLKPRAAAVRDEHRKVAESLYGRLRFSDEISQFARLTEETKTYVAAVKAQTAGMKEIAPRSLATIAAELAAIDEAGGESPYAGIFVPGGHVPLEDLMIDPAMGAILNHFHARSLPTGLVCHGPVALLAAKTKAGRHTYKGYRITAIEGHGERMLELVGPLRGYRVSGYVDDLLEDAGVIVRQTPSPGYPLVVMDRELLTGQNPASGPFLARAFVAKLRGEQVPYLLPEHVLIAQSLLTKTAKTAMRVASFGSDLFGMKRQLAFNTIGLELPAVGGSTNLFLSPSFIASFEKLAAKTPANYKLPSDY